MFLGSIPTARSLRDTIHPCDVGSKVFRHGVHLVNLMERKAFKSVRTSDFRKLFKHLPARVQATAAQRYENYFRTDPYHPLLRRHSLHDVDDAFKDSLEVEMARGYRAVGYYDDAEYTYVWYWCGSHAEYDLRFTEGR